MKDQFNEGKLVPSNIRKAREYRNYSQDYLAYKLGISQNAYSKIELGYTKITVQRLFDIASILEFDITDLLDICKLKIISNMGENLKALQLNKS